MSTTILGVSGAIEQPKVYGFRYGVGPFTRRRFECTSIAAAQAVANTLVDAGYSWTITEGIKPVVEAEIQTDDVSGGGGSGTPEVPELIWEFLGNSVTKKITDAPTSYVKGLSASDKQLLTKCWDERGSNTTIPAAITGHPTKSVELGQLYTLLLRGADGVNIDQPILKRTMVVSQSWQTKASMKNVGRILTTATLKSAEEIPDDILISIDNANLASGLINDSDGLVANYGWRKIMPQVTRSGNQKTQIAQNWEFGLWPEVTYLAAI